ncbi:MAG: hypothetical protein HQK86_00575 [Nitrospinae bacterium]|nr:hypothetical protein [Nitrospinota bacterium]
MGASPATAKETVKRRLLDRLRLDNSYGRLEGIVSVTYELDAAFIETDFLPTILGLGAWDDTSVSHRVELEKRLSELGNVTLMCDPAGYHSRPRSLRISVHPWKGVKLHSKVVLILAEKAVVLVTGSANLTHKGYRSNREVAAVMMASAAKPEMVYLILSAIEGLRNLLNEAQASEGSKTVEEAISRLSKWDGVQGDASDRFIWSGSGHSNLLDAIAEAWPKNELVHSVDIVSPFWAEKVKGGPIEALSKALILAPQCKLTLYTEATAATPGATTFRPILPHDYATFDFSSLGFHSSRAVAVNPTDDDGGNRALHAKTLLIKGAERALAYLGSANCTWKGWNQNIETGLLLLRKIRESKRLDTLLPSYCAEAKLEGDSQTSIHALLKPDVNLTPQWPSFVISVELEHEDINEDRRYKLRCKLAPNIDLLDWSIYLAPESDGNGVGGPLFHGGSITTEIEMTIELTDEAKKRLCSAQEVMIRWNPGGERRFPINVAVNSKDILPLSPNGDSVGENDILNYYQDRISWEEIFGNLDDETICTSENEQSFKDESILVDTSKITSYRIRSFVEALPGLAKNIREAMVSGRILKMALLGDVSPVALSRQIRKAGSTGADADRRSITACSFQMLEILICMAEAMGNAPENEKSNEFRSIFDDAMRKVYDDLKAMKRIDPTAFAPKTSLAKYEKTVKETYGLREVMR